MKMYFRVFKFNDKIRVCLYFECSHVIKCYPIDLDPDDFSNEILSNYDFVVENKKAAKARADYINLYADMKEEKENGK